MNRPDIYKKSVQILYDAYFNDTLIHGECTACAVGNLVASNCGIQIKRSMDFFSEFMWKDKFPMWKMVHTANDEGQRISPEKYLGEAKRQIDSTGYTWQETAKIELSFESAPKGNSDDDWMYNGLVAVLDCLAEIHGIEDVSADKKRFELHHLAKAH